MSRGGGGLFPTCQELPERPPGGAATVLASTSPRQVATLLPCQDDRRSLSRDLPQASVLGTRLLLSREPKYEQRCSAWIPCPATTRPRTAVVLPLDQTGNLDSTYGHTTRGPTAPGGPLHPVKHLFSFFPHPWKLRYAPYLVRTTSNIGRDLSDNTDYMR